MKKQQSKPCGGKVTIMVELIIGNVSAALCEEAYRTLANQKDSQMVIVKGAAHAMVMERQYYKIFREEVLKFLEKK